MVKKPFMSIITSRAQIVPPPAALPDLTWLMIVLGHIGMVVSENALERTWDAMADWLGSKL